MTRDDIIALPNSHLRQKSNRVLVVTDKTRQLVEAMIEAALDWENSRPHEISAALAAVQVDRLEKVIIVRNDFENKQTRQFTALINPEVIKYGGAVEADFEGCLSVRHIYGKVPRHTKVRIKALDLEGNEVRIKAEGFLARVLQHEIDHINGMVFIDRIKGRTDAFYRLDDKGELQPLNYEQEIATNNILWD